MGGLIDADKFILALMDASLSSVDEDTILDLIDSVPTVDAVPVVRCKDCKYTRKVYGRLLCKYGTCTGCILRDDFFCANGERRGGGEDG